MPKNKRQHIQRLVLASGYAVLVKQIRNELEDLEFFVRQRTVQTYWRVGKFIYEHILENRQRADYGGFVLDYLSEDVGREVSTLRRALKFYRLYPIRAGRPELSWEHYRRLITVQDKSKREAFEKIALRRDWTVQKLEEVIRLDRLKIEESREKYSQSLAKLSVTRSRLFTYKILEPSYIHPEVEFIVVDLGFNFNIKTGLRGIAKPEAGELVESIKSGNSFKFKHSDATKKELYTYKALVERVVDADTIWLNVDLGFNSWVREKVRLRGIDAPELSTKEGQRANKFVEARLKEVDFVVVKTYSSDKYERYLTDLFYLKNEDPQKVLQEGIFLNQQLLDLALAKIMKD